MRLGHFGNDFAEIGLDEARLGALLTEHERERLPRFDRLWRYYRNPADRSAAAQGMARARLAQEEGLPARFRRSAREQFGAEDQREVVIENDIAWRLHAMVDFMFGRPVQLVSTAEDETKRQEIGRILDRAFEASGGVGLLQDMALVGAIYGHVDLLVRWDGVIGRSAGGTGIEAALRAAERVRIEAVDPTRAIPLVNAEDFRRLDALVIRVIRREPGAPADPPGFLRRRLGGAKEGERVETLELISPQARQVYRDRRLVEESANPLGELPVAHIQNVAQPLAYEGLSEVEPLIPLQDELNTRLSDRAHRVTMQSFKMFLAKGMDLGGEAGRAARIGPGQVWSTENPDASIEAFGGDGASPSEDHHIEQIRQALDKTSGVTPVAAGVLGGRVGQLSSENALRITLMGLLAKTARKQVTYGRGLSEVSRLVLKTLDVAGVYPTREAERGVRIAWPDPLPGQERERLETALLKRELGVERERVLAELGYAPADAGVT